MKYILIFFLAAFTAVPALAQNSNTYEISFPNAIHHEAEVSFLVPRVSGALTVRMSRSSPGRYATHEFGKNVYHVKAYNSQGKPVTVTQTEGDVWQISGHDGSVKVTYTVFGNWVDGTYLAIDETHAHINMPATFMWAVGMDSRPVNITFNDLDKYKWRVATQLFPTSVPAVYTAPGIQYFMDSPVELSAYRTSGWTDTNTDGKKQQLSVSSHSVDDQPVIDAFTKQVKKIVDEAKMVYGELASYDNGTYTFLHDVAPDNDGDGMEHRNSTVISQSAPQIAGNEIRLLGTFSHEFFHSWNVERIRPKTLEPFNFSHANMSSELWFAEGFTQYYGGLLIKRAGFNTVDGYCQTLAGIINGVVNAPGATAYPATQMSRYAVFADAGVSVDLTNKANIFTSYYTYGAAIALALDLRLRTEFKITLDDYMKAVWQAHGKTEKPYSISDLQAVLAKLCNPAFAADFFNRYVHGIEKNDYVKLLARAGLILRKVSPGKATLGARFTADNGKIMSGPTFKGSAAYEAGLESGDYLLKIGQDELKTPADVSAFTDKYKPGDVVSITYTHKGVQKTATVKLPENAVLELVPTEKEGGALTAEMEKFRSEWLASKVK